MSAFLYTSNWETEKNCKRKFFNGRLTFEVFIHEICYAKVKTSKSFLGRKISKERKDVLIIKNIIIIVFLQLFLRTD